MFFTLYFSLFVPKINQPLSYDVRSLAILLLARFQFVCHSFLVTKEEKIRRNRFPRFRQPAEQASKFHSK